MMTQKTLSDIWHSEEKAISILGAALDLTADKKIMVGDVNIKDLIESASEILKRNDALFNDATLEEE